MDYQLSSPTTCSSDDLVNMLRLLITNVTLSSTDDEQKQNLERTLVVLRTLRDRAPALSPQLSDDVRELLVDIEPALSTIGTVSVGVSTTVAFVGLLMQGLCQEEGDRHVGRQMTRIGGAVALGSIEIVCTIRKVVAEIKGALPSSSASHSRGLPSSSTGGKRRSDFKGASNSRGDGW